ncbi:MAG: agmatine deiminase family protein [Thaumarchaeota archaeon]|nr:agmatine deiminase family protein [Candidatus Calditenuaceae archaeon]MDW8187138.1 agmatine deiminase family protein [Nitrososphaerota archaeon]
MGVLPRQEAGALLEGYDLTQLRSYQLYPGKLGFRRPPETWRHEATWLVWPHNEGTFPEPITYAVKEIYIQLIDAIRTSERVKLVVGDASALKDAEAMLSRSIGLDGIQLVKLPAVDVWIRDYGPVFLVGWCGIGGVKFAFNAWGRLYPELIADDLTGARILEMVADVCFFSNYVLEGGMLDIGENGEVIVTKECLLDVRRNGKTNRRTMESVLKNYLGVKRVYWLSSGIIGDDTRGHVDTFARFGDRGLLLGEDLYGGPNAERLEKSMRELAEQLSSIESNKREIIRVPMPPEVKVLGVPVPATYLNFCLTNKHVIVPVFGKETDEYAASQIAQAFPGRSLVTIRANELFYGLGGFHCVTLDEPSRG